ncbi:hypothetical protein ACLMR8_001168 [Campylobacter jejuni]|nr:hypothetical protein [Campylobacter jejuni]EGS5736016.1 hypothetical protein [Campylobacter jejuni]EGU0334169.1 hypothetical protein [Campylobacter jejuni]EHF1915395.1 hypothetical protein [Campylobacter jejuni]EJJ8601286.1 hypothetical protein [Campylobacter jejuni]
MTVVRPLEFEILENSAKKDETPLWNKEINYKNNEKVQFKGFVWVSASDEDTHEEPDVYFDKWVKFAPINENAFFDDELNTQTKCDKAWSVKLKVDGVFDTLAFLNLDVSKIKIETLDGKIIYEKSMYYKKSRTWWEYFFSKFKVNKEDFVFLPYPINSEILISFEPAKIGCNVGHILIGKKEFAGVTIYPANSTYINYSKTSTNEWGVTNVVTGKKAKYLEFIVAVEKKDFDYYDDLIAGLYNTKALFIGDESELGFKKLTTFGILKDYSAPLEDQDYMQYKLNIQGLI